MIKHQIEINSSIYNLAEAFRNFVSFVFEGIGKDSEDTRFETFNDIGNLRKESTSTGFFSFRNEDSFYWIFLKITHSSKLAVSQSLCQEFEVQIKKENVPILQIYSESIENDSINSNVTELKPLRILHFEFEEKYSEFAEKFLEKIEDKLKVIIYEPIAA